jgi:hypothetical protein
VGEAGAEVSADRELLCIQFDRACCADISKRERKLAVEMRDREMLRQVTRLLGRLESPSAAMARGSCRN